MARILAVGIATLDIVNTVEHFPAEDEEVRALAQTFQRGGNATNTLVVLAQLGHNCDWAGVWIEAPGSQVLAQDLDSFGIGKKYCQYLTKGRMPTSCVLISKSTASRTIVHFRNLPEYSFEYFRSIPLQEYEWLHFEARNVSECCKMMKYARECQPDLPVSLEVEKPREGVEKLYTFADYIFFSPQFVGAQGGEPAAFLKKMSRQLPRTVLTCTLGDRGAIAIGREGTLARSSAYAPGQLVETLGAGDTFNAGFIDACLKAKPLPAALEFACRLSGKKCGQQGFSGLGL